MFRKVSTLLVLASLLAVAGCEDEIVDDAIPVSDAAAASDTASDHAAEASREGGTSSSDGAIEATGEGGATTGDGSTTAESSAPDAGSKADATTAGDGGGSDAATDAAASDAPPG